MPYYLSRTTMTPETWAAMIRNPENREEVLRSIYERLGGKLHQYFFALGENGLEAVTLAEMPDTVSSAALTAAVLASGALKSIAVTPLMTFSEGIEFLKKAREVGYRPPSG